MKKYSLAIFVLATSLAVAPPSALCDTFGYRTSDSKFGMNSSFDGGAPGHKAVERPITGAFFFGNLLQGNKGGSQKNSGAISDLNGQQLVLLSGSRDRDPRSGNGGQFFFADKGTYKVGNEFQRGGDSIRSNATAPTVTPEPGSLFLLGAGLLGLALILFWKAAKHATGT